MMCMLCVNKVRYFENVSVKRIVKSIGNKFFLNCTAFRRIHLREDDLIGFYLYKDMIPYSDLLTTNYLSI